MLSVAVGLFAHNEGSTLDASLGALLEPRRVLLPTGAFAEIERICVVSCASTDETESIARRHASNDARIELDFVSERRGKARAINRFVARAATADVFVLVSGDVVLAPGALAALVQPFVDPAIGMTGARPSPSNAPRGAGRLVRVLWDLHDRVARDAPKLGEAVAVRAPCPQLPDWTRADEASFEAHVTRRGERLVYCPDAIAHNHGPTEIAGYFEQRSRIAAAHVEIERDGYVPTTRQSSRVLRHAARYVAEDPRRAPWVVVAALVEGAARVAGRLRARPSGARHDGTWTPIASARIGVSPPPGDGDGVGPAAPP